MAKVNNDVTPENCSMDAGGFKWRNLGVIITSQGYIIHPNIRQRHIPTIEGRLMLRIHGIVVHQTGGKTVESAWAAAGSAAGAHFYIDKDGTIYQAASINNMASHIGKLKPRCLAEHRCTPTEAKELTKLMQKPESAILHHGEMKKPFPDRYPSNNDSIGIELVGGYHPVPGARDVVYETVTEKQKVSLKWLIQTICDNGNVKLTEIYRHPMLSWKNATEASTAEW